MQQAGLQECINTAWSQSYGQHGAADTLSHSNTRGQEINVILDSFLLIEKDSCKVVQRSELFSTLQPHRFDQFSFIYASKLEISSLRISNDDLQFIKPWRPFPLPLPIQVPMPNKDKSTITEHRERLLS